MLPVVIIRHVEHEGPGYLQAVLNRFEVPVINVNVDKGDEIPDSYHNISGLVLMGGPMSVNDPLEWIHAEINLVRLAIDNNLPVLGHCLGGQIIAKALGVGVKLNSVREIGWHPTRKIAKSGTESWVSGLDDEMLMFHWHAETFDLPYGAIPILSSEYCENQGFVYGNALALQCHIEMTEEMVATWCDINKKNLSTSESVQSADVMLSDLPVKIARLNRVADKLYSVWIKALLDK